MWWLFTVVGNGLREEFSCRTLCENEGILAENLSEETR